MNTDCRKGTSCFWSLKLFLCVAKSFPSNYVSKITWSECSRWCFMVLCLGHGSVSWENKHLHRKVGACMRPRSYILSSSSARLIGRADSSTNRDMSVYQLWFYSWFINCLGVHLQRCALILPFNIFRSRWGFLTSAFVRCPANLFWFMLCFGVLGSGGPSNRLLV